MKKKILFILGVLCFSVSLMGAVACSQESSASSSGQPEQSTPAITADLVLSAQDVLLILGNQRYLVASYNEIEGNTLTWTSSNNAVATVENGMINALTAGETVITATYGEDIASCKVTVITDGFIPSLVVNAGNEGALRVTVNDTLDLGCKVLYNSKYFTDFFEKVSYTFTDDTIGKVDDDGIFTPLKEGTTNLTISAKWHGFEGGLLTKTLEINVVTQRTIMVNDTTPEPITLYMQEEFAGATYTVEESFTLQGYENGVEKACTVSIEEGEECIDFDDSTNTVSAKKAGSASLKLAYPTADGEYYVTIPITVLRPTTDFSTSFYYSTRDKVWTTKDGVAVTARDIFGYETTIEKIEQEDNANISIENGEISNVKVSDQKALSREYVTVYNDKVGYRVPLDVCTKVLFTAEDLKIFDHGTEPWNGPGKIEGYYVLGADIDAGYTDIFNPNAITCENTNSSITKDTYALYGFAGTFDGMGHSLTFKCYAGLFNNLLDGFIIRNVAFKDILIHNNGAAYDKEKATVIGSGQTHPNATQYKLFGTISNVYISFAKESYSKRFSIMPDRGGAIEQKNIVVDLDYANAPEYETGATVEKADAIYYNYYECHNDSDDTTRAQTDNINIFLRNYDETKSYFRPFYLFRSLPTAGCSSFGERFTDEAYAAKPYGHVWYNFITEYGQYDSYADFANGTQAKKANGGTNWYTITAKERLDKFAESGFWDITNGYPVWKE
ncbi:MAG: hypothetical protein IJ506_02005 [Clostridia bacterium]|nr:hypothetical protein [Clostridia bacterium]